MGPDNERDQAVKDFEVADFATINSAGSSPALFSERPHMDNSGNLMFKTNPNANGTAKFSVVMHDNGGVDDEGVDASDEQDFVIQVDNDNSDMPKINFNAGGPQKVNEGTSRTYSYKIDNTNADDVLLDINESCGKAGKFVNDGRPGNNSFQCRFPDGPASSTVSVGAKIRTQVGTASTSAVTATPSDSIKVNVVNVAPRVALTGPAKAKEGQKMPYMFTMVDPGLDTFSFVTGYPNCDAGNKLTGKKMGPRSGILQCQFLTGASSPTISLKVKDSDGSVSNLATRKVSVAAKAAPKPEPTPAPKPAPKPKPDNDHHKTHATCGKMGAHSGHPGHTTKGGKGTCHGKARSGDRQAG